MKLAFSAWAVREWPVERQMRLVNSTGYLGICLVSGAEFPFDVMRTDRAERRRLRRLLDEAGLAVTAIASHVNLLEADAARLNRVRAALDVVVRRRELDHPLQKLLDVRLRHEPDGLPRLVRFPEFVRVEVADAGEESPRRPLSTQLPSQKR